MMTALWWILGILGSAAVALAAVWAAAWNTGSFTQYEKEWNGRLYRWRVKNNHWLVPLTPWSEFALTLGDQMFCEGVLEDFPETHAHEFNHIIEGAAAMADDGVIPDEGARRYGFYLRDLGRLGYKSIPEEIRSNAFGATHRDEFTRDKLKAIL